MTLHDMIIDEEFRNLIPALSSEEYAQLENNILEDGIVHDPIILWKGENIIVDGHNRYAILMEHPEIPYSTFEKEFGSRDEAIEWICQNQLGRRNISDIQRTFLLGIAYEARKRIVFNQPRDAEGHFLPMEEKDQARFSTAQQFGTTVTDVERSGRFIRGLNEIEKAYPGTIDRVKNGELEVTKKDVMSITTMEDDEKEDAMKAIAEGKRIKKCTDTPIAIAPVNAAYDISDFRSELHRKAETLDKSLELTCILTHKDMLDTEEGKEALRISLLEMTEVLKKYFEYC